MRYRYHSVQNTLLGRIPVVRVLPKKVNNKNPSCFSPWWGAGVVSPVQQDWVYRVHRANHTPLLTANYHVVKLSRPNTQRVLRLVNKLLVSSKPGVRPVSLLNRFL